MRTETDNEACSVKEDLTTCLESDLQELANLTRLVESRVDALRWRLMGGREKLEKHPEPPDRPVLAVLACQATERANTALNQLDLIARHLFGDDCVDLD